MQIRFEDWKQGWTPYLETKRIFVDVLYKNEFMRLSVESKTFLNQIRFAQ